MAHYRLTYFEFRGKAEIIRYLLAYLNAEYEEHTINYDCWPEHKASYPYGKLPVLEINGTVYNESLAVSRYLARKAGLIGKTELEDIRIDAILDTINEFVTKFPWFHDEKIMTEFSTKNGPTLLSGLEKELGENNWFAGDYVTWADFFWDICSDSLQLSVPNFAKDYPKLMALKERVKDVPEIAAWIKRRP